MLCITIETEILNNYQKMILEKKGLQYCIQI